MTPIDYGLLVSAGAVVLSLVRLAYLAVTETDDGRVPLYRTVEMQNKMTFAWEWVIAGSILLLICALIKVVVELM